MRYVSATCAAVSLVLMAAPAAAQTVAETIRAKVETGQRVAVTADTGQEVKGRVIELSADALTIREGRDHVTVPYLQIIRIEQQKDNLANGMLIGLGVGAVFGAKSFSDADPRPPCGSYLCGDEGGLAGYLVVWGGLGAVLGAAVDAVLYRRDRTVFGRTGPTRVRVSPQVQLGVQGVVVSMSW